MKVLKYKGESYNACAPRRTADKKKYTCDAWKERTQRVVKDPVTLHALGEMLIRRKNV